MRPTFDQIDHDILQDRRAQWNQRTGPRVGDWLEMPNGPMLRFTHDWGDGIQTTTAGFGLGSFYFGGGYMDYSGALDTAIPKARLVDTGKVKLGEVWFFHHDRMQAHNGVYAGVECRVYRVS